MRRFRGVIGRQCCQLFYQRIEKLSNKCGIPISVKDLRRVTFDPRANKLAEERKSMNDYVLFDLKKNSF